VALVKTDFSEERITSIFTVTIGEVEKLAVTATETRCEES
jgi:hypothetical protein